MHRIVPWCVDQHEPGFVIVVRPHRRVVGRAHVDRRIVHGVRIPTEDGVELGVVVLWEPHVVVQQARSATTHGEEQHESGQARVAATDAAGRFLRPRIVEEFPVHQTGIGVGHHDVCTKVLAVRHDPGHAGGVGGDRRDVHARAHVHAAIQAAPVQRIGERAQPTAEVPRAEFLFHVRNRGQHRRRAPRVGSGVGRVSIEQRDSAWIGQCRFAECAQTRPRGDGPDVGGFGQWQQALPPLQGRLQERTSGESPHLRRSVHQRAPVLRAASSQSVAQGLGAACWIHAGHGDRRTVCEVVAESRLDRLQVDLFLQRLAGLEEEVPIHRGQREQTRAGVEGEAVAAVSGQLPAHPVGLFEHGHVVALHGQARRGRKAGGAGSHHDHRAHRRGLMS